MLSDQEKRELKSKIKSNQHELFVISIEEMDAIVRSSPKEKMDHVQVAWKQLKSNAEASASYYASADDLRTLSKLVGDLGGFATKTYIKTYAGKPHIILKGRPGLRRVLTGTKYGIKNPKVLTMGLGKAGAIHAAKSGGIISIVLLSAYRVTDYFLTDQATLSHLIGSLATDVVKVGITTGASIAAASAFVLAIGPIAAVVLVGIGVAMGLSALDERYGITDRVIAGLDETGAEIGHRVTRVKRSIQIKADRVASSMLDYVVDSARSILITTAKHTLDKFLSGRPRLY